MDEGLSLALNRDKHRARGGLSREQLVPFVERGDTLREMAEALDRSPTTIRYWLARHGLNTSGYGHLRRKSLEARRIGNKRFRSSCKKHGETEFLVLGNGRARCAKCSSEAVSRRRRKVKRILVEEAGGRCELCGYDRCIEALHFHHRDPSQKLFGIAERGFTRSLAEVREEARKCALLCANCHTEVETGIATLPMEPRRAPR